MIRLPVLIFGAFWLCVAISNPISSSHAYDMEGLVDRALGASLTPTQAAHAPQPADAGGMPDKWNCAHNEGVVRIRDVELCHVVGTAAVRREREPGLVRYRVLVEKGLDDDTQDFIAGVDRVLSHPSGWQRNGVNFVRVMEDYDLTVLLAEPASIDTLCRPLRTGSWLSCAIAGRANINATRWREGTKTWGEDVTGYHFYLINHEVGHLLGLRHARCPGPGEPAPIMLPQTKFLKGCVANGEATPIDVAMLRRALPGYERRRGVRPIRVARAAIRKVGKPPKVRRRSSGRRVAKVISRRWVRSVRRRRARRHAPSRRWRSRRGGKSARRVQRRIAAKRVRRSIAATRAKAPKQRPRTAMAWRRQVLRLGARIPGTRPSRNKRPRH